VLPWRYEAEMGITNLLHTLGKNDEYTKRLGWFIFEWLALENDKALSI